MGAENDRVFPSKLPDEIAYFDDLDGVQPDGRLIEDNDLRVSEQRLGDSDPLLIALGKG